MSCEWRPISELKPVLGKRYVVAWANGEWNIVMWKTNSRWGVAMLDDPSCTEDYRQFIKSHPQPYFGDESELDDYEMALPENAPTLYLPFQEPHVV